MARIRTIKPSFFTDAKICRLSVHARLLFVATWTIADDTDGVFDARLSILKTAAFLEDPFSPEDIARWFAELTTLGLVWTFEDQGVPYGVVRHWGRHQVIHKPGKKCNPDPPPEPIPGIPRNPPEISGNPQENPASRARASEGKGKEEEGKGNDESPTGGATSSLASGEVQGKEEKTKEPKETKAPPKEAFEFRQHLHAELRRTRPKMSLAKFVEKKEIGQLRELARGIARLDPPVSWEELRAAVTWHADHPRDFHRGRIVRTGLVLSNLEPIVNDYREARGSPKNPARPPPVPVKTPREEAEEMMARVRREEELERGTEG